MINARKHPWEDGSNVRKSGKHDWEDSPLHILLCELFPHHRTILGFFAVNQLAEELGLSYEAVYQWLRKGRLTPQNARVLMNHAGQVGSRTPDLREFDVYVFGA